ncbi:MAG: hypothetical protein IJB41_00660 [Clostridia bacterium]|nr:hypothetical protein [Clostridia bacterium]
MRFHKVLNVLLVAAFLAAMTVPLLTADFEGGKISVDENRYLAMFPQLRTEGKWTFDAAQFNSWINDNIGGRALATKADTLIDYHAFGLSSKYDTLIGKDGWMYYYTEDILDDYSGTNLLAEEKLEAVAQDVATVAEFVDEQGAQFLFVIAPDKKTVYPEKYTEMVNVLSETKRTQQLLGYLREHAGIRAITLEDALVSAKEKGDVYSPRVDNAHWNMLGGYIGYERIMQELKDMGVEAQWTPLEECTITEYTDQALFNSGVWISETAYSVYSERRDAIALMPEKLDAFPFLSFNKNPDTYKKYYENADESLPSLLYVGDSYSVAMFEALPQSFSKTMFLHSADLPVLADVLQKEQFDVVIIESAERMLDYEFSLFDACATRIKQSANALSGDVLEGMEIAVDAEWGYQYLDYCDDVIASEGTIWVQAGNTRSYMEGWALDPLAGSVAGRVIIEVGGELFEAEYGKERDSVAAYFQNDAYLCSGYTAILDTQKLIDAGQIAVHVISQDGTYQYPPAVYTVKTA